MTPSGFAWDIISFSFYDNFQLIKRPAGAHRAVLASMGRGNCEITIRPV